MSYTYKKVLHKIMHTSNLMMTPLPENIHYPDLDENQKNKPHICDFILFLLFMHIKHISKYVEMKNDTLELVLRSDPNSVVQDIKQSCVVLS